MAVIKYASKWDLDKSKWYEPNQTEKMRSFAIGSYLEENDMILNTWDPKVNYIIINYGVRVEDHSKDAHKMSINPYFINRYVDYFLNSKSGNYVVKYIMLDADAPLIEQSKKLAGYIDALANNSNTGSIHLVGLSKCGTMNMYIPRFLNNPKSFDLLNLYNIATPYNGTVMASPSIFYPQIKELVTSRFGNNKLSESIYNALVKIYESISSNSHMDYDIAKPGGVPEELKDKYDEEYIKNIFSDENLTALRKVKSIHNFTTGINSDVLKTARKANDFVTIGLSLIDGWFFNKESDGFVKIKEQHLIEDYLDVESTGLASSHMVMTSKDLDIVFQNIEENVTNNFQRTRCYI